MKAMVCEMCQSNDIVKQDGMFVCQHCGTKYSVEEARKLLGSVKIDKTEETEKLLLLARRARDEENSENAEKYYINGGIIDERRFIEKDFNEEDELVRVYSSKEFIGIGKLIRKDNTISVKSDKLFIV